MVQADLELVRQDAGLRAASPYPRTQACEWCNDGPSIRAGMDIAMQISLLQSVPKKDLHNMLDRVSGTVSARQHQGHDRHWLHCGASPGYTEFELI
jgi:hypothetical protein